MKSRTVGVALLAAALDAVPSLLHAFELQPGTWQDIETGTENGKPVPPETTTTSDKKVEGKWVSAACKK
ncbi:MAG: hypothetical protein WCG92_23800 [Hyphomicrobiales bacterium]